MFGSAYCNKNRHIDASIIVLDVVMTSTICQKIVEGSVSLQKAIINN